LLIEVILLLVTPPFVNLQYEDTIYPAIHFAEMNVLNTAF